MRYGTTNRHSRVAQLVHHYTWKDVALYALAVGAAAKDACCPRDLPLVYEGRGTGAAIQVFPTFAVTLIPDLTVALTKVPTLRFDPRLLLHGEHELVLCRRLLPPQATLVGDSRVTSVVDKGKAAVVVVETVSRDQASGEVLFVNRATIFLRGAGGFTTAKPAIRTPEAASASSNRSSSHSPSKESSYGPYKGSEKTLPPSQRGGRGEGSVPPPTGSDKASSSYSPYKGIDKPVLPSPEEIGAPVPTATGSSPRSNDRLSSVSPPVGRSSASAPASSSPWDVPARDPDAVHEEATAPSQALLYRLCGDPNPLHADPAVAAAAGFERPILHGLCTLAFATRAVVRSMARGDPSSLLRVRARFLSHVYPGERLQTRMWVLGPEDDENDLDGKSSDGGGDNGQVSGTSAVQRRTAIRVRFACQVVERGQHVLVGTATIQPNHSSRL
eukprot:jgi/Mesvir1/15769/Mv03338-RA.2